MNNLYGGSQAEALPISDFRWDPNPEKFMDPNFIEKLTPDDPVGYWLECDIDFGKELHDKRAFNCYPPLPETKVITYKMLSPKAKKLLIDKIGKTAAKNYKSKKLISTLQNKRKYKVHYLNLQQAMKFGCKLRKVHRVISFKQKKISENFLNFMTKRRKYSKTKIEERLCKGKIFTRNLVLFANAINFQFFACLTSAASALWVTAAKSRHFFNILVTPFTSRKLLQLVNKSP